MVLAESDTNEEADVIDKVHNGQQTVVEHIVLAETDTLEENDVTDKVKTEHQTVVEDMILADSEITGVVDKVKVNTGHVIRTK